MYNYRDSLKSSVSDELINTYLLRPLAGLIVWVLYYTPITPNQVTIASTLVGVLAAVFYLEGNAQAIALAGLCVTLKDILDSADGQLARAKQQYSRIGRFLDSIGDFVVDVVVFGAIGWVLYASSGDVWMLVLALVGLVGISLRVSYHVFYQASFLHLKRKYENNRLIEEVREEDTKGEVVALRLQKIFQIIYGWQDRLMLAIDKWCRSGRNNEQFLAHWYADTTGLRISGLLGFGTELFLLMVCSVLNRLELYLYLNVILMNGIWTVGILYRKAVLKRKIFQNHFTQRRQVVK